MKKVLVINTIGLNYEGITSVIYNYCNALDKKDIEISFIGHENMNPVLKEQFESIGEVLITPKRKSNIKGYIKSLDKILKSKYDVVHIHGNSGTMAIETILAKIHGVKNIIIHGHSTKCNHPIINKVLTPIMKISSDYYIGCSNAAGSWLYGKSPYIVLNNAIDINKYVYNDTIRKECRKELGVMNEFIIGHIGHFTETKNHTFIIDIFEKVYQQLPTAKLLLVSDGPKLEEIKEKVSQLGLDNRVIFTGRRNDAYRLYQAMDLFLFPSLWEGLGMVTIEAQTASLPVLASDTISQETNCTNRIFYKSLDEKAGNWAKEIINIKNKEFSRKNLLVDNIRQHGFDINKEAEKLREIYIS